jgi:hypothetical protein
MATKSARAAVEKLFTDWRASGKSITALAEAVGVERATLYVWHRQGYIPEVSVPIVAQATGLHPGQLRPDLASHYYSLWDMYTHEDSDPPV